MEPTAELTFGGKMAGVSFNPSGDERVAKIKGLFANIIDELAGPSGENMGKVTGLQSPLLDVAVSHAITAQMWAVKAITFKD